ncbi:MAG: Gfo/Idh/MocA family oxidoreductase, partial [Paracoccaceae bacterium]
FVEGRKVDDNAHISLRYKSGARGQIWATQIAPGNQNNLCLRVYGSKGGLEWQQEDPNTLWFTRHGEPKQMLTRGSDGLGEFSQAGNRVPAGHPEGYLEAFATLYSDVADLLQGKIATNLLPTIDDGLDGMWFIEACIQSSAQNGAWIVRN